MTIGQLKDLQDEYNLDDDTLVIARVDEQLFYLVEDIEVEPVEYDSGLIITRSGTDAIIVTVDNV